MSSGGFEHLLYNGESPQSRRAFERYIEDVKRGKSGLQLKAVADQLTPDLRSTWIPQSFTPVSTPYGDFDATVCTVSYHFHTHGQKYGSIRQYTEAETRYFKDHAGIAPDSSGFIRLPMGIYDREGKIVTFFG